MLEQGDGLLAGLATGAVAGGVTCKELDKGCSQLFGRSAGPLAFERMPVPFSDAQASVQLLSQWQGLIRPLRLGRQLRWGGHERSAAAE